MKLARYLVLASAVVLTVACGGRKAVESTDESTDVILALEPTQGQIDSVSYLVGVYFGTRIVGDNFGPLNYEHILAGMKDFVEAKSDPGDGSYLNQFKVNPEEMNIIIGEFLQRRAAYTAAVNRKKSEDCLKAFLEDPDAKLSGSGLAYKIVEPGDGRRPVTEKDTVWVDFKGTLPDGTIFDQSRNMNYTLAEVIPGWQEGLKLIGEGGKIQLAVPYELAYGEEGNGKIEPYSALLFDIDLLKVSYFQQTGK